MRSARLTIALVAAVLGLVYAGTALAEDPPVIDQYQEPLPTGGGDHHTGGGGGNGGNDGNGGNGGAQLPNSTQENLANSVSAPVAQALETVATSPDLGAPQGTLSKKDKQGAGQGSGSGSGDGSESPVVPVEPLSGSPLTDAVSAATDGGNSHLVAVLLALAALTLGAGLAAVARRRQTG